MARRIPEDLKIRKCRAIFSTKMEGYVLIILTGTG
jgi:hypothetical protein